MRNNDLREALFVRLIIDRHVNTNSSLTVNLTASGWYLIDRYNILNR